MAQAKANRDAVVAIQGGGIYGFTLLGQLQAVLQDHKYDLLAFAGTSAGAIVATLAWAGFTPEEIRDYFGSMASGGKTPLCDLVGPCDPPAFDLTALATMRKDLASILNGMTAEGDGFFDGIKRLWALRKLVKELIPHYKKRGFFAGLVLEKQLDAMLRQKFQRGLSIKDGELLSFGHVKQLMERHKEEEYRPPLLLTVTNLTKRRLELITSFDEQYSKIPIAKAVRASAGFPVFFSPRDFSEHGDGGWYVDGGLISNFPIWTFSDAFRARLFDSPLYGHVAKRPWIRIGLRAVEDATTARDLTDPLQYFKSIAAMLTGATRNELEDILAATARRSLIISQPYSRTNAPEGFLDINSLTADKIDSMVARGREFANEYLRDVGSPGVISQREDLQQTISRELKSLVERCDRIFSEVAPAFRANVFMPVMGQQPRMKLIYSYNMDGDGDKEMEFPDLWSGATGLCYSSRRPIICNLSSIAALRQKDPDQYSKLFGMDPSLQGKVRADRSWLASVPIFDSYEVKYDTRPPATYGTTRYRTHGSLGLETEIDGPVLGVLNLDAGWDYSEIDLDPNPDVHFTDRRIEAILAIMQAASSGLASELSEDFPRKSALGDGANGDLV